MRKIVRLITVTGLLASFAVVASPSVASAATVRDITTFACRPDATTSFTDIAGTTHEASIACIVSYGLASGTSATTYGPGRDVTRGQMATFLANFVDLVGASVTPLGGGLAGDRVYSDVAGNTHEDSIYYLTQLGIAQGTSATTFSPNQPVTRGQMATFLVRTMEVLGFPPPGDAANAFTDDDGGTHEASANAVAALGIAQGTAPGIYQPGSYVTRGAMATFLARMLDLGIEVGFALPNIVTEALAALDGNAVTPGPGATGTGTAVIGTTDVDDVVCFQLYGVAGATAIEIHQGAAGANGPAVATIPVPAGDAAFGCAISAAASGIAGDPDSYYVDVHSAALPDGALRGQLGSIESSASAGMTPEQVVPGPGSQDAFGFANVVTTSQPEVICVQAFLFADGDTFTGFHLHTGALHSNGALVLDIPVDSADVVFVVSCLVNAAAADVATAPEGVYLDAHTTGFPDGAVRGQLSADF